MVEARVHRFHDKVATDITPDGTHYLTPDEAQAYGEALLKHAEDCRSKRYLDSTLETFTLTFPGTVK